MSLLSCKVVACLVAVKKISFEESENCKRYIINWASVQLCHVRLYHQILLVICEYLSSHVAEGEDSAIEHGQRGSGLSQQEPEG